MPCSQSNAGRMESHASCRCRHVQLTVFAPIVPSETESSASTIGPFFLIEGSQRPTEDCSIRYNFAKVCQSIGLRERQRFRKHGRGPRIHDLQAYVRGPDNHRLVSRMDSIPIAR